MAEAANWAQKTPVSHFSPNLSATLGQPALTPGALTAVCIFLTSRSVFYLITIIISTLALKDVLCSQELQHRITTDPTKPIPGSAPKGTEHQNQKNATYGVASPYFDAPKGT